MRMVQANCPQCGHSFQSPAPFASRRTNHGNQHARDLAHFLNTQTKYEADLEPKSNRKRLSGVGMRPDLKVRFRDAVPGTPYIFIERQEQNTTGTGNEKIANKIHKALVALQEEQVRRYYIVLAGRRLDLLQKVANDTLSKGGAYPDARLKVIREDDFKELAMKGIL